jgi:hypothetical protein
MSNGSWSFRTTEGTVTVGGDAITIRSTPGEFLSGQLARLRNGTRWGWAKTLLSVLSVPFWAVLLAYNAYTLLDVSIVVAGAVPGLVIALMMWDLWARFFRERTIPRSSVESVRIDEADRTLRIVHESTGSLTPLPSFWPNSTRVSGGHALTLAFPTDEAVREARDVFHLRNVPLDPPDNETDTAHRYVVEESVYFCEDCGSQVSPADSDCPACGYALRVEEATGEGSIGHATN